jgi:hypothetical protein
MGNPDGQESVISFAFLNRPFVDVVALLAIAALVLGRHFASKCRSGLD